MLVSHSLFLFSPVLSFFSPFVLFKEVELLEACQYGLVKQVHSFTKTAVNVNMADSVSGLCTSEGCALYCNYFHSCIHVVTGCTHFYQYAKKNVRI